MNWTFSRVVAAALLLTAGAAHAASVTEEAQALLNQGQHEQALKKLDSQLKAQPQDAEARFLRGLVLVKLDKVPDAIKAFADLTRDYPQLPEPYNNLAVLYAQQGDYEKARDALEAALATHPSYATAHENLGDIYAALAGAAYNRALMLDQNNQLVRSKLSLVNQLERPGEVPVSRPVAAAAAPVPAAPAPAAAVAPAPVAAPAPAENAAVVAVSNAVSNWASTWSARDTDAYLATYSPSFSPEGGLSRPVWENQRRDRIARAKSIRVRAVNPQVTLTASDRARVEFTQEYESDAFSDTVTKVLELQSSGGSWLIVREYTR